MADGVAMEIGPSAQLNAAEDLRCGIEPAQTLLQLTVEQIVRVRLWKLRIATRKIAQVTFNSWTINF